MHHRTNQRKHPHSRPHKHTSHSRATRTRPPPSKQDITLHKKKPKKVQAVTETREGMPRLWTSAVSKPDMGILFRPIWLGSISGSAQNVVKRFNTNSIWCPEVGGTGGQTPGYVDWANFYGFYRVVGYKYKITVSNKENFDVNVWTVQSSNDPGTSTNSTINSNPMTQMKAVSAKGGMDRITFKGKFSIETVCGTSAVYSADTYRSIIGANPGDVTWLGIGVQSFAGNLTNGVDVTVELSQKTIMYDYLLQTPAELEQIQNHRDQLRLKSKETPKPKLVVVTEPLKLKA